MTQSVKDKIKQVLERKKQESEALLQEMEAIGTENSTITIESLYSQLESLKHEIDIETIQKKLQRYDEVFKLLIENKETIQEIISWYSQNKTKLNVS